MPTYIGNRPGTNPGSGQDARLSGTVEIQGLTEQNKAPSLSVAVLANGVLVARQRVQNRGSFNFTNVPRNGVTLIVEIDNQEIGSYPVGTLTPPPMSNRKDIFLTWASIERKNIERNEVLSLRNAYIRTDENQKAFDKAISASKDKNASNAVKLFRQLVEKDAADFVAWSELGNLYFKDEKYQESEAAFAKAVGLKGDFLPALVNLGKVQLSQKSFESAVQTLSKAIEVQRASAEAHHYLGEAYLQSKQGSKAVVHLNKALELAPQEKAEIHLRLAMLYNAAGLKDRASLEYKAFLEKVPDHPEKARLEKYISDNPVK
ncbi:MAG: tetratricopeptide repeat protein [Acidobacteria bacterium]|nr:tetratricopeptide repeat protein [Acidobacteriota bacterium]